MIIKPFQAIRPKKDLADKVAALPYDVYSSREAREVAKDNAYSFLHIDRAEIDLPESINMYGAEVYEKARKNLETFLEKEILVKEEKDCYYLYRLTMNGRAQTGFVCCSSIDDYLDNNIKKHELTREAKEQDRIRHVDTCDAHTGPIFLTYRADESLRQITEKWMLQNETLYHFTTDDEVTHQVWRIDEPEAIARITVLFQDINSTYIADGHHRAASAVKVGLKRREEHPDFDGSEEFNSFLSVLFPHDELFIMDYNRVVKDLNGLSKEDFLDKILSSFDITLKGSNPYRPEKKGLFGLYLEGNWYALQYKKQTDSSDPVQALDVSILQKEILEPILGIEDIRNDNRIDFVGGIRGLGELERRCREDMKIAFSLHPTSVESLMAISDAQQLMPPKSTWFEPKLRSGLFIHSLS